MEESQGWIKIYRKILDNPIMCKDSDFFSVWIYLLLNATHKEQQKVFNGNKIILQKGQLITGRKVISSQFNICESKVQRILKKLEIEQQIEQQNGNKNRLISILNWEQYQNTEQQTEQQVNNKRTTTEQQVNTNKNVKKENNDKNVKNIYGEYKRIKLLDSEYEKLITDYSKDTIDKQIIKLDEYVESNNNKNKYTNYNLVLRKSLKEKWFENKNKSKLNKAEEEFLND